MALVVLSGEDQPAQGIYLLTPGERYHQFFFICCCNGLLLQWPLPLGGNLKALLHGKVLWHHDIRKKQEQERRNF